MDLERGSTSRRHAYTALPSQRVAQLSILSTLFPHLPAPRSGPFRAAGIGATVLVALLAALHLFAPATAAAVLALPVLYLMYLYEVEVYENEPWIVIGGTMVVGAVLGVLFTNLTGGTLSGLVLTGDRQTAFVLSGFALPIVAQALMLAGPTFLYLGRGQFREPLDGLTFGAASALGFTLASSLTALWPILAGPLISAGSPVDWALRLARIGLLLSVINACTTGLVAASVWLQRYDRRRAPDRPSSTSVLTAVVVAFGVQVSLGIIGILVGNLVVEVAILAVAAAALLVYLRFFIHQALLVEGAEHEIGPDAPCSECHHLVPTMAFCPSCGAARAAGPKQSRVRIGAKSA